MNFSRLFLILFFILSLSCEEKKLSDNEINKHFEDLNILVNIFKEDFNKITKIMQDAAEFTTQLYRKSELHRPSNDIYTVNDYGIMHKKKNDGKSAVFVSGYHKINDDIKNIVYITEPLDSVFKAVIEYSYRELDTTIIQIYYNDRYSYHRIYPFLDVLVQYEPKIDVTKFNFYYAADRYHNPEKKVVWLYEPYVDPAGRGWMISCIAPVYFNDTLCGVLGVDITINKITRKYLRNSHSNVIIVSKKGTFVAANECMSELLLLPSHKEHKYFGAIKENTFKPESHKIVNHNIKEFREYFMKLLLDDLKYHYILYDKQHYHFLSSTIPESEWILIKTVMVN